MIKVRIPNNNILERKYVLEVILKDFLFLSYEIEIDELIHDYRLILDNGKILYIEDHFFNLHLEPKSYLDINNIPKSIKSLNHEFLENNNLPVLFGDDYINIESDYIKSKIDIFATIFFMLTRWEEYVNHSRDEHNRFSAYDSIAYKFNFLNRPIVDEYVNLLRSMLINLGHNDFKKTENNVYLTHDIDDISTFYNFKHFFKLVAIDIVKKFNVKAAILKLVEYINYNILGKHDPVDTFDKLMYISESKNIKSRFYCMSGGITNYDNKFNIHSKKAKRVLDSILNRGHILGFHPSYNSYNNKELFNKELKTLEEVSGTKIEEGRQHYLRFEVPTTWQIWDDLGMKIDSSCGYADMVGFRCGTGKEYRVFNILTQKKLSLKERPLVMMDSSLFDYNNIEYAESEELLNNMRKYSDVTLLWHNSYITHFKFYEKYIRDNLS